MPTVDDLTPDPEPDDDALPVVDRWPSPPAPPACDGVDPALFTELGPMREFLDRRGMPATWAQMRLQAAFAYCARCPVQDWCIDVAVRPEASGATIVAGGALFVNGERRWGIDELLADDEAAS